MKPYNQLGHVALGTALRQLATQVTQDAENTYQQFDFHIEPKWFPVFYVLASHEAESVVNIAREIKHSHVSVSKIIKEMKQANLVESNKSPEDSRVTLMSLNDKGKAMIPAMLRQVDAVDQAMQQLKQDMGIDLWQAITLADRHLKYRPISTRVNESVEEEIRIVDYSPQYQTAFKALNVEWISQHWELEEPDYRALENPESYILDDSGVILLAVHNGEPVGCCALIRMDHKTYELAKMAVSPQAKGQGIGYQLGCAIVARAKAMGIKRLYLESNSVLVPAVNLYKKLGFTDVKTISSPYARCDVQMELLLNE